MPGQNDLNIEDLFPGSTENPTDVGTENPTPSETPTNPEGTDTQQPDTATQSDTNNSAIRQMREAIEGKNRENSELKAQIEAIAQHLGVTPEEFLKQKEEESLKEKAQKNQTTPEVQKKLDEYDKYFAQQREAESRKIFNTNLSELMTNQNLTEAQAGEFLKDLTSKGIDVLNTPISHLDLYYAFNRENIMASEREKIRQEVLAEIQNSGTTAAAPGVQGTNTNGVEKGLDDFLNDFAAHNKK